VIAWQNPRRMHAVSGRAPVRVDLAGGTLDIWPIHLTLPAPGVTVNAALDLPVRAEVRPLPGAAVRLASDDQGFDLSYDDGEALRRALASGHGRDRLLARAAAAVAPEGGYSLRTRATAPAGSGLGGSSALLACAVATLASSAGRPMDFEAVRRLSQDVETAVVAGPTGYQDYYPPLYGGVLALEGRPGGVAVERLPVDVEALSRRVRLVYTGAPHDSGVTNWGAMRAYFDGEPATGSALREIADLSRALRDALRKGDLDAALPLVVAEGAVRRRMAPGIATRTIDALDDAARRAGALGTKVMGAGGGGSVLVCLDGDRDPEGLERALAVEGCTPLPSRIVSAGLSLDGASPR
jgi:D-glycero-alpha-D-manno-heptose-7-phosphate kinase